jgi:hypothetical protein
MRPLFMVWLVALLLVACGVEVEEATPPVAAPPPPVTATPEPAPEVVLEEPVPFWEDGAVSGEVDAVGARERGHVVLDLGEGWTPYLFTDRDPGGDVVPHGYRSTYLALARGEFPDDHHGARAERDRYLELYGIPPTLGLLRERFRATERLACAAELDLAPLRAYDDFLAYRNNRRARQSSRAFARVERRVAAMIEAQGVGDVDALDDSRLDDRERRWLRDYLEDRTEVEALRAAQARLACEGYYGDARPMNGGFDWVTHEALAEFERRHRIYGWGFLGRETLEALREPPLELERRAVVRVLTERAMHALGVIEDGSAPPGRDGEERTYRGLDGQLHPVPNLEAELEERVVEAFGLRTPESALAFLEGLGELGVGRPRLVAFEAPPLPDYYGPDMDLTMEIDRGDVWYDFPYGPEGEELAQPVGRRPRLTVFARWRDQRIPIARFGTTIGGWRSESIEGEIMWRYKMSPTGARVWSRIVAAPVWMPPPSTPARDLVSRGREPHLNLHEVGPSYASAYGLVAAYHERFRRRDDGTYDIRGDEGIRTHGSVDYMSIMRRHSHGCHRLHNHLAVRLMSFVLAHRPHRRVGHQPSAYRLDIEHEGRHFALEFDQGGYEFELEEPVVVRVLEGRIRGQRQTPIEEPLPRYDEEVGAYLTPDGTPVRISRTGQMTEYALDAGALDGGAPPDGGVLDAGVPAP